MTPTEPDLPPDPTPPPLSACALARAIEAVGDARTLLVLREALCGVRRFSAMHADLGIPRSVLADRLSRLVALGLLERRRYREPGARAREAYVLTDRGRALVPALVALRGWAEAALPGPPSRLRLVDREGREVSVRLVRADGSLVEDPAEVRALATENPASPS
jgi:DNA-binding HxlR family transcriptional regulator